MSIILKNIHSSLMEASRNISWSFSRSRTNLFLVSLFLLGLVSYLSARNSPAVVGGGITTITSSTRVLFSNIMSSKFIFNYSSPDNQTVISFQYTQNQTQKLVEETHKNSTDSVQLKPQNSTTVANFSSVQLKPQNSSTAANFSSVQLKPQNSSTAANFSSVQLKPQNSSTAANFSSVQLKPQNSSTVANFSSVQLEAQNSTATGNVSLIENLKSCDIFDGRWVLDYSKENQAAYEPGSCPFLDDAFNCFNNGRPDSDYLNLRWKPNGCQIPRLKGQDMLEMLRGKRLVFVGDSLNRNMWESLVCTLRSSLTDKTKVFEVSGKREFRTQGFYSFRFQDYNCSIEFIRSPFLVQEWKMPDMVGGGKETLRLDLLHTSSLKYHDADVIVFNTAHWWTHEKTSQGKDYYQVGNHVYHKLDMEEAYTKALRTWARWVDTNIDPSRSRVFFRGYSASHFSGGRWNAGGTCDGETQPIENDNYLEPYPKMMSILETVIQEMKTPVFYLNITRMTDYRKDAHPSIFREPATQRAPGMYQDCSHWCLPGVPDTWNELLYASLLKSGFST